MNRNRIARSLVSTVAGGAFVLSVWSFTGKDRPAPVLAGTIPLLVHKGGNRLSVDRRQVRERIRRDLSLSPLARISVDSLPSTFRGPEGGDVSASLSREAPEGKDRYLYRLNVMEGGVAREAFYLHVRVLNKGPVLLGQVPSPRGSSTIDDGGTLVHSGDSVRVTARGKGFLIRFNGISQSGGMMGDQVQVVNPLSGATMVGQITGRDRIVIHLSGGAS
jgi:hypothetical protein